MDGSPTVSVIIPTYNRAHVLGRSIQSVLNQTYQDFELIVVDDGSSDNTEEVVRNFNDIRIKYIRHDKNRGVSAARNTGIKAAQGEYIAFNDSDDEWLSHHLEKLMLAFEKASPQTGVVYSGFIYVMLGGKGIRVRPPRAARKEGDIRPSLLKRSFIYFQTAIVKRQCFEKVGLFDERIPCAEDWELWLRISTHYHFKYVGEPLVVEYESTDGLTNDKGAFARGYELVLARHFQDFLADKRVLAYHYFVVGLCLCASGEFQRGRNYFMQAVKAHPLGLHLCAALVSLLGQRTYNLVAAGYRKVRRWLLSVLEALWLTCYKKG